jgi:predicted AAA+ superfamily ATPase
VIRDRTHQHRTKSGSKQQEKGLERQFFSELPDIQSHALVVNGIRRCGKSTLLRQFVQQLKRTFFYLNFDDIRLAPFVYADFRLLDAAIIESGSKALFFDEIQSVKKWELYIRQKLDEGFQVVITGSNASLLSRELGSRLTRRHISKELFPFSYEEFCLFLKLKPSSKSLLRYLEKGGFPEFLKTDNADILVQLQSDILYRDIAVRYGICDASSLKRLFIYLVSNPAQFFSPSKLTGITGVKSPTTVLECISHLESAYFIHLLPCFSWSIKAQNLARKKIYIADSGIIKTSSVSFSDNYRALFENFIFCFLRSKTGIKFSQEDREIFYFSGKNGNECDFILFPYSKPSCIQVCWELTLDNQDREIDGLLEAMGFFNLKKGLIVTFNTKDIIRTSGKIINVIPAWQTEAISQTIKIKRHKKNKL